MKIKRKLSEPKEAKVDDLAREHLGLKETEKANKLKLQQVRKDIMQFVSRRGSIEGKRSYAEGVEFKLVVVQPESSPTVNWAALLTDHPELFKACTSRAIDPKKIETLIRNGTISRKLVAKYTQPGKLAEPRLLVQPITAKDSDEAQDYDN